MHARYFSITMGQWNNGAMEQSSFLFVRKIPQGVFPHHVRQLLIKTVQAREELENEKEEDDHGGVQDEVHAASNAEQIRDEGCRFRQKDDDRGNDPDKGPQEGLALADDVFLGALPGDGKSDEENEGEENLDGHKFIAHCALRIANF